MSNNVTEINARQKNIYDQFSDLEKAVIDKYLSSEEKTFFIGQFLKLPNNNKRRTLITNFQKIVSDMEPEIVINGNIRPFLKNPNKTVLRSTAESGVSVLNPATLYVRTMTFGLSPLILPISYLSGRFNAQLDIYKSLYSLDHERTDFFNHSYKSEFRNKLYNTFKNGLNFYNNSFFAKIIVSYIYKILKLSPNRAFFDKIGDPRTSYFSSSLKEIAAYASFNKPEKRVPYQTGINVLLGIYQSLVILEQDVQQISQQTNSGENSLRRPLLANHSGGKKKKSTKSKSKSKKSIKKSTKK